MTPGETPRMAGWLESAWLARYLDRQLAGDELAWFEAYLLDKPELLGMVEVENGLREALASSEIASTELASTLVDGDTPDESVRPIRRGAGIHFAWAAALALGLGVGWFGQGLGRREADTLDIVANPTRVVFDIMRGAPDAPIIEHEDSGSSYMLVEVAVPPRAEMVQLQFGNKVPASLAPSADGFVSFLVSRSAEPMLSTARVHYVLDGRLFDHALAIRTIREGESK